MKAAVIGLGAMGMGAAQSLLRAGIETTGYDIVEEVLDQFAAEGGGRADAAAAAVKGADVVLVFLLNAQQVRSVLFGSRDGAVAAADLGTVFVLNATMGPAEAEALADDLLAAGMQVIDAPVSGGREKAAAGDLTLIASGADAAFDRALPVLEAISSRIIRLGETPGSAARVKMINQLLAGVHTAAMAEAMVLAARDGLDLKVVHDVVSESTGQSRMFESRGQQVAEGAYTPHSSVDIVRKDLGLVAAMAGDLDLPLLRHALALFEDAAAGGLGRQADACIARLLAERAGVELPEKG
ncbi:NAD-binding protein [Rhodobacteraceae bacterium 2CG4]|uniref:NAD-binding protein n=1 Tax=Halovulum marinum TaxID=2662447 RepID=A0A6L5Z4V2_9RHOB|nr:NAD(P)-dependent oxidoreductase [Halovulum marinum]MSU91130.1 NAD-binding protein [Halovulum marinum]